jgi:uncharacterized protein (DUF1800 family)
MSVRPFVASIRFGLGPRLGEALPADPDAWLAAQIASPPAPPEGPSVAQMLLAREESQAINRMANATPGQRGPVVELVRAEALAWAERRLTSPAPFHERWVDFWMNHFTASRRSGVTAPLVGCMERDAIRAHLGGRFTDLLWHVTLHPAMLTYLDNLGSIGPNSPAGQRSRRGLNENLAREVLELHTLSPAGGYTQGDVQELAKILTGHGVATGGSNPGYIFRTNAHEPGEKNLLGRRFGEGEGAAAQALAMLGTHAATYRHLAVKIARHFVADHPPAAAVRALETALRESNGSLPAAQRALIRLREAWEPPLSKFRTPQDHVLAACRATGAGAEQALAGLAALGQTLWTAPQPNGWSDLAADWIGPEAMMRRVDWNYTLAGRVAPVEPAAVVEAALGPLARAETVTEMRRAGAVRDALTLLLSSPEFAHR